MKHLILLITISLLLSPVYAQDIYEPDADTSKIRNLRIDEITVRSPKYNSNIFQLPASATMMPARIIENYQIGSLTDISGLVPNFFMPDYGSKLTSPVYIRGIGTRINTPSVGLYVDNIPYFEKSAFNFDFFDLERIEVLRGPQGTLYGRNTMAGLVNIFTADPSPEARETSLRLSYGNYNQVNTSLLHNQPLSQKLSMMMNFNQLHNGGFYTNNFNNEVVDKLNSYSGRMKLLFTPDEKIRVQLNLSFENSEQGGYPYGVYDFTTQITKPIEYNHPSNYDRKLLSSGLNIERKGRSYRFRSVTSYQFLDDIQDIDQDFTKANIFTVVQLQKQHMVSQEFSMQNYENDRYEYVTGVFGFHQTLDKSVDVNSIPQNAVEAIVNFSTNSGIAFFHQSTLKFAGFALTGGIRADFENASIDYNRTLFLQNNPRPLADVQRSSNFFEILPRFSLQYNSISDFTPYVTITKGYNAGGFNTSINPENHPDDFTFKAEQIWNYEAGLKSRLFQNRLFANLSVYNIDWQNQQIYQPVPTGQGSMLKNAGKSNSKGIELEVKAVPATNFEIWTTFGYNKAIFLDYVRGTVDYTGNYIPFAPKFTTSLGGNYSLNINKPWLQKVHLYAVYQGFGKHYWNEGVIIPNQTTEIKDTYHNAWQDYYGLLNSRVTFAANKVELSFWGKNLLNANYNTHFFTIENPLVRNSYAQVAPPASMGIALKFTF
jgi:iron complex outermembrane recepter protein